MQTCWIVDQRPIHWLEGLCTISVEDVLSILFDDRSTCIIVSNCPLCILACTSKFCCKTHMYMYDVYRFLIFAYTCGR